MKACQTQTVKGAADLSCANNSVSRYEFEKDMNERPQQHGTDMPAQWLDRMRSIGEAHGFYRPLGAAHAALFIEENATLLVTFDNAQRLRPMGPDGFPVGFEMVEEHEYSMLSVFAEGATWFRDEALYAFFDGLADDGFFDQFDRVIFLGIGPSAGYAACAFSVAAPGAEVLASSPVATLDRADVPFESRFAKGRRLNFNARYGFAPDLLGGASRAFLLFDLAGGLPAAHAALFRAKHIHKIGLPRMGPHLERLIIMGEGVGPLVEALAGEDAETCKELRDLLHERARADAGYLKSLMVEALKRNHHSAALRVARHGAEVTDDPIFARHIASIGRGQNS